MLTQMRAARPELEDLGGLQFFKLMGSGGKNGFAIWPNFNTYAFLGVWDREECAESGFEDAEFFNEARLRSSENYTLYMHASRSHGQWDGQAPFNDFIEYTGGPIAVVTRATIKWQYVLGFWSRVRKVSRALEDHDGLRLSIGIGEYPLFMQSTFSLWDNADQMRAYAYKNPLHQKVIKKTRELGWYSEELFANFIPYRSEGSWESGDVLKSH